MYRQGRQPQKQSAPMFGNSLGTRRKIRQMVHLYCKIEYIITDSRLEALVLKLKHSQRAQAMKVQYHAEEMIKKLSLYQVTIQEGLPGAVPTRMKKIKTSIWLKAGAAKI